MQHCRAAVVPGVGRPAVLRCQQQHGGTSTAARADSAGSTHSLPRPPSNPGYPASQHYATSAAGAGRQ